MCGPLGKTLNGLFASARSRQPTDSPPAADSRDSDDSDSSRCPARRSATQTTPGWPVTGRLTLRPPARAQTGVSAPPPQQQPQARSSRSRRSRRRRSRSRSRSRQAGACGSRKEMNTPVQVGERRRVAEWEADGGSGPPPTRCSFPARERRESRQQAQPPGPGGPGHRARVDRAARHGRTGPPGPAGRSSHVKDRAITAATDGAQQLPLV